MFNNEVDNMTLKELVNYITVTFHKPLRDDLDGLDTPVELLIFNYSSKYDEFKYLKDLFYQFKTEILKHITKEDLITFPAVIEYEKIYDENLINTTDDIGRIEKLVNDVEMKNQHGEFNTYLTSIIELLNSPNLSTIVDKEFKIAKGLFEKIEKDNLMHAKLENEDLYSKGMLLQLKLKRELELINN